MLNSTLGVWLFSRKDCKYFIEAIYNFYDPVVETNEGMFRLSKSSCSCKRLCYYEDIYDYFNYILTSDTIYLMQKEVNYYA